MKINIIKILQILLLSIVPLHINAQYFDWVIDKDKAIQLGKLTGEYLANYGVAYALSETIKTNEIAILKNIGEVLFSQKEYLNSLKTIQHLSVSYGSVKEIINLTNNNIDLYGKIEDRCKDMGFGNIRNIIDSKYFIQLVMEISNMTKVVKDVIMNRDELMRYDERIQMLYYTKKLLMKIQLLLNKIIQQLDRVYIYGDVVKKNRAFSVDNNRACSIAQQTLIEYSKYVR